MCLARKLDYVFGHASVHLFVEIQSTEVKDPSVTARRSVRVWTLALKRQRQTSRVEAMAKGPPESDFLRQARTHRAWSAPRPKRRERRWREWLTTTSLAAFFTFLRANLVLTPSAISSPGNTPYLEPYSPQLPPYHQLVNHHHHLQQQHSRLSSATVPTPSPLATQQRSARHQYVDDDVPPLSLDTLSTSDEKVEGLRLVADSVAQMRPRAARILARHPLFLAALASAWALVYGFVHASRGGSAGLAFPLACVAMAAYLLAIRFCTASYDKLARSIDISWLQHPSSSGHEDVVLGARRGGKLVGALVLRIEPRLGTSPTGNSSSNGSYAYQYYHRRKNRSRSASFRGGRGVIRAWTTLQGHRGEGVGRELLHAAVRRTRDVCGRDAQVGFAKEHANSVMFLPEIFTAPFKHDERRAAEALNAVVDEWDASRRKKR
ncbi:hypothetical protein PCL_04355 [Purpureocillium lilacinum]|uniref:N-acetyltransferase domain-containing protein n=1 Tax=Purpureocillium lilacinum TaxID=33203 RepID=A0A2U3DY72_PURLI|nr:hypothetical protein Purlil1_5320 [Purpureocillium lilacinum]PWI67193.1 hypothetical protein PCL_04355 [Purpureocillium lilacinum]